MTNSDGLEVQFPYEFVRDLARRLLGKRGRYGISASSVVQEAFVAARGTVPVASIQRPRAWWGTVVRNTFFRLKRSRFALKRGGGRKMALLNADVERDCRIQHAKPLIAEQQLLELIPAVMLRARREVPKFAEVLALVAAGQSEAEIAASLGVTVTTAIQRSERAQRWLRGQLEKED